MLKELNAVGAGAKESQRSYAKYDAACDVLEDDFHRRWRLPAMSSQMGGKISSQQVATRRLTGAKFSWCSAAATASCASS